MNCLELLLKKCQKKAARSSVKVVKSIVRQVKNAWQLMKMYDAQSVNTCVKLAGFVNWKNKKAFPFRQVNLLIPPEQWDGYRRIHNTSKQRLWITTQVSCLLVRRQLVRENPWNPQKMGKEKLTMLKFICGVLVGGIIEVVLMCLLQINKIR